MERYMPVKQKRDKFLSAFFTFYIIFGALFIVIGLAPFVIPNLSDTTFFIKFIFSSIGLIFFLIGLIPSLIIRRKRMLNEKLFKEGQRIFAEIAGIEYGNISVDDSGYARSYVGSRRSGFIPYYVKCLST